MKDISLKQALSHVIDYYNTQNNYFKNYFINLENQFLESLEGFNNVTNYVCKNNTEGETVLFNTKHFQYENPRLKDNGFFLVPEQKLEELNKLCSIKEENEDRFNRLCSYSNKLLSEIASPNGRVSTVKLLKVFPEDMVFFILNTEKYNTHEPKEIREFISKKSKEDITLSSKAEFYLSNIENDLNLISMNNVVYA